MSVGKTVSNYRRIVEEHNRLLVEKDPNAEAIITDTSLPADFTPRDLVRAVQAERRRGELVEGELDSDARVSELTAAMIGMEALLISVECALGQQLLRKQIS